MSHIPVLLNEVTAYLNPQPNDNFIDCTLGEGGHAAAILSKTNPNGKLLGFDLDRASLSAAKFSIFNFQFPNIKKRLCLIQDNFKNIKEIARKNEFNNVTGILMDLGLSSRLLENSGRGFSFQKDETLDMRFGSDGAPAVELVNQETPEDLERILREFGEEPRARDIVKAIIAQRKRQPIITTRQLIQVIEQVLPRQGKVHPATRTFQALRMAVNHELENLEQGLKDALEILAPHGRLAVISYHSLEDRLVKQFFKKNQKELTILTKKPLRPTTEEIKNNPRSRSAKLRVAEKTLNPKS